jgi:osmotically-inducible protein OsmY
MVKIAGVALAAAMAIGCGGADATEDNVRLALEQANIEDVAVDVDDSGRVVRLTGTVGTMAERTRAEEVASAVVGTTGQVVTDLSVAGVDVDPARDADVAARLDAAIDADPVLRERDISVDVAAGVVTVTGEVRSAGEKRRVADVVRGTTGVAGMNDELEIAAP